jgi:hypothetical protein
MDHQVTPELSQSSAVRAFENLCGEVSLLRRAIEGLTAERRDQPDYSPTLEALATSLDELRVSARRTSEQPALRLTPHQIGEQIEAAASRFREQDRQAAEAARGAMTSAIGDVKALSRQARTAYEQVRREKIAGGVCFLGGFMLWPILEQIVRG